ncbi:MAG: sigma-70 family RNA polymerase sigma factor, partial [Alphaproteobacteria bacterium]|nr:sigma-70 family RNA polymerase sigma factor [Alphaproteobacteria bacterium]
MDDSALVSRAAAKDVAAFSMLARQHQSKVRGLLMRLTRGNHTLADDLAQETFLEAWRGIGNFRGESAFATWLYRIAYSRFL